MSNKINRNFKLRPFTEDDYDGIVALKNILFQLLEKGRKALSLQSNTYI